MKTFIVFIINIGLLLICAASEDIENLHYLFPKDDNIVIIKTEEFVDNKCPELFSTSLDIECFFEKNVTQCDEPMSDGTIAKFKCKHSYYHNSMPYTELQCVNRTWNQPLFNCNPDCGKKTSKGTPLVIKGASAEIGDFPWHIGLYKKGNNEYSYICGGSIFSPKLVVSAAHCFVESMEPRNYHVTAGKVFREWKHINDLYAQYRDVVEIIIPKEYKAEKTGYAADIAILVLDQVFILSNLVLPVCIEPHVMSLDSLSESSGKVAGWGLTEEGGDLSDNLQYVTLPLIDHDNCLATVPDDFTQYVTLDKICAGYTNGTSVCEGDSGGGLVYERKNDQNEIIHYLIGAVSTSPVKDDSCHSFQYTTFTNIEKHIDWINETKYKYEVWSPYDYGCILPDPPTFGTYVQLNVDASQTSELRPGYIVPHYTKLNYSCDPGFEIQGKTIITCKEKVWNIFNMFPTCFRTCPKLFSPDLEIEYSFQYTRKPSGDSFLHETRAIFRCKDSLNYELEEPAYNLTTCRDGLWTRPLLKCVSICGRNDGESVAPSHDVLNAHEGQYPWHVGVYQNVNFTFELKCTGTILSAFVVIIDSNCVDKTILHRYLVVAGSTNSSSNYISEKLQRSQIYRLLRENQKTLLSYELLILKRRLKLSSFIRPVCLVESDVRLARSVIEIPFWEEGDFRLKTKIDDEESNCDLRYLHCSTFIPNVNKKHVILGKTVRPTSTEKGKRYYLLGYQTENQLESSINVKTTFFRDTTFIKEVLDKYNVKSDVMSECILPDSPSNAVLNNQTLRPGEMVLESTKISYICKVSEYEMYNSTSMLCSNTIWTYPDEKEPTCIACGSSKLIDSSRSLSTTGSPYISNVAEFPWNVGLYNKTLNRLWYFCAGTLVTANIVLTDGKCFTEYMKTRYVNENKFVVVAGILNWDWNTTRNINAQHAEIHEILFSGILSPIAIIVLNKRFEINTQVAPACLDVRGVISRVVKAPFPIFTPFWVLSHDPNKRNLQFMHLNKRFVDGKLVDLIVVNTTYCPSDDFWKTAKGSGSALQVTMNGRNQFFIDGLFSFSDCSSGKFFYRSLRSVMNELVSIIASKNV